MSTTPKRNERSTTARPLALRRVGPAAVLALSAVWVGGVQAQAPTADLLSDQRIDDRAYGLSFLAPIATRVRHVTLGRRQIRVAEENDLYAMTLEVKTSRSLLTLEKVIESAREQVQQTQGTSQLLQQRQTKLGKLPAAVLYFRMPQAKGPEALLGEAIIQIDPSTYGILTVNCKYADTARVRPIFEAVLGSLEARDPKALDAERRTMVRAGIDWRRQTPMKTLRSALIPIQIFRLVEDDRLDVGYVQVRQFTDTYDSKPGVAVEWKSRVLDGDQYLDTLATFFLANDDSTEIWSIKTTKRHRDPSLRPKADPTRAPSNTIVETGVRDNHRLRITVAGPRGSKQRNLPIPKEGYLSQVEVSLLPQLLPFDRPATYGFYYYNATLGRVTLRTDQVVPALRGYRVLSRASPDLPLQRSSFTAQRRLQSQQLSETRKLVPTTSAALDQIWRGR